MRNWIYRFCTIVIFLGFVTPASAQKVIKLDEGLKSHSSPMTVKRKGAKAIGKYQFGPYRIVAGHAGWSTTDHANSQSETNIEYDQKSSFVFQAKEHDPIIANIGVSTSSKIKNPSFFADMFGLGSYELEESKQLYTVAFKSISDQTWNLAVISPMAVEIEDTIVPDTKTEFEGLLTDGISTVKIEQTFEREDGKSSLLNVFKGYEFYLDGNVIGAVQVMPINKQLVWIHDELDENMQSVVATLAVSLLVKTF